MSEDFSFLDNLTILSPEEREHITRDPVLVDAKDWAENGTMPPDRRGLLRLLISRAERVYQAADERRKHLAWAELGSQLIVTTARVARIQQEFADDLAEREGNIYEQVKDLVEQFHVEREYHEDFMRAIATAVKSLGLCYDEALLYEQVQLIANRINLNEQDRQAVEAVESALALYTDVSPRRAENRNQIVTARVVRDNGGYHGPADDVAYVTWDQISALVRIIRDRDRT